MRDLYSNDVATAARLAWDGGGGEDRPSASELAWEEQDWREREERMYAEAARREATGSAPPVVGSGDFAEVEEAGF